MNNRRRIYFAEQARWFTEFVSDPDANDQIARIAAGGGSISKSVSLTSFIKKTKELLVYNSGLMAVDANWGVVRDGSNKVSKMFSAYGNTFDWEQETGSAQPTWIATGGNLNPAYISATATQFFSFSSFPAYNHIFIGVRANIVSYSGSSTLGNYLIGNHNNSAYLRIQNTTGSLYTRNYTLGATAVSGAWHTLGAYCSRVAPNGAVYLDGVDDTTTAPSNWGLSANLNSALGTSLAIDFERMVVYGSATAISIETMEALLNA